LLPSEVEWAVSRRLPLLQTGKELSFEFPCKLLEARGTERVCGDYENRPAGCRAFECKVLLRYKRGELPRAEALAVVRKARTLITGVEQRLGGATLYGSFASKLEALADGVGRRGSPPGRKPDTETLLDLGALRSVVEAFHEHRAKDSKHLEDDQDLLARASDPDLWDTLFLSLGVDALDTVPTLVASPLEGTAAELRAEGYATLGTVLAPDEAKALASIVSGLAAADWPKIWEIPRRFEPWLKTALGEDYEMLPAVWASHVAPDALSTGGGRPHRDGSTVTVGTEASPHCFTLWIALTDANPDNGCTYLLPPACDPFYGMTPPRTDVLDVQNVRALPAAAGTALAWDRQVLHWDGRSTPSAKTPRISLAFAFRRAGAPNGTKSIDQRAVPPFGERLACIAAHIVENKRFGEVDERFLRLAAAIAGKSSEDPPDGRGINRR
jgi:hypothetical protein